MQIVHVGDNVAVMRTMPDNSVDSIITDPPAGIAFMSKSWDHDKGGRDAWVSWMTEVLAECWRVAKPGAHAVVWALPRTSGWTHRALEDAGWEVRDCLTHLTGQGFPKSLDVSKAIDKAAGAEREVVGQHDRYHDGHERQNLGATGGEFLGLANGVSDITAPATPEAERWAGWGTALKPGAEFWYLARKPLIGTVAANVLAHGTGAINIDGCRIGNESTRRPGLPLGYIGNGAANGNIAKGNDGNGSDSGRWPANVILSHHPACVRVGVRRVKGITGGRPGKKDAGRFGAFAGLDRPVVQYASSDGTETISAWDCHEDCAVAALDAQSGERGNNIRTRKGGENLGYMGGGTRPSTTNGHDDSGGPSRFFLTVPPDLPIDGEDVTRFRYVAKASRAERNAGLDGMPEQSPWTSFDGQYAEGRNPVTGERTGEYKREQSNFHPTVKPIALMRWLVRLVTPPGGTVLDPFTGSGSTGCAAAQLGVEFIGIEAEEEYAEIARRRIAYWAEQAERTASAHPQLPLFAAAD